MGSWSQSNSNTTYTNQPLTLNDANSGVAIAGSGNAVGNSALINGANTGVVNNLDGGAIQRAFDSTDKSIAAIADLTAKIVSSTAAQNTAALGFTEKANEAANAAANPTATAEKQTNYTIIAVVGLVVVYLVMRGAK